jgi:hypothetical protein
MSLETELSPKYRDIFLDPVFQNDFTIFSKYLIRNAPEFRKIRIGMLEEDLSTPEGMEVISNFFESPAGQNLFSNMLTLTGINKRLGKIEKKTGTNDVVVEWEEREPTYDEKIAELEGKVASFENGDFEFRPTIKAGLKLDLEYPESKKEHRIQAIVKEAAKIYFKRNEIKTLPPHRIDRILLEKVAKPFAVKAGQNISQAKKELFPTLQKLGFIIQEVSGHRKGYRIVFDQIPDTLINLFNRVSPFPILTDTNLSNQISPQIY